MKVQKIQTADIHVGDRYRELINYDVGDLMPSIKQFGLLQPIVVLDCSKIPPETCPTSKDYILLAGGRRFACFGILAANSEEYQKIPAHIFTLQKLRLTLEELQNASKELIELKVREIELEENLQRKDLSPVESVRLTKRIHEIKTQIYGEGTVHKQTKGWQKKDTARELSRSQSKISEDLKLADAIDFDEDVLAALEESGKKAALRVIKKKGEKQARQEVRKAVEKELDSMSKTSQGILNSFQLTDAFEAIKEIKTGSVDFIDLDPPWAIPLTESIGSNARADRGGSYTIDSEFVDIKEADYAKQMLPMLKECKRTMSTDSWLILWYGIKTMHQVNYDLLKEAGFTVYPAPGLWVKDCGGGWNRTPDYTPTMDYETFFIAKRGSSRMAIPGASLVFPFKRPSTLERFHPTEKPVELMMAIIKSFSGEKARVLTPFAGSGNTIWAAHALGGTCTGFDVSETYYDAFAERLSKVEQSTEAQFYNTYNSKKGETNTGWLYNQAHAFDFAWRFRGEQR